MKTLRIVMLTVVLSTSLTITTMSAVRREYSGSCGALGVTDFGYKCYVQDYDYTNENYMSVHAYAFRDSHVPWLNAAAYINVWCPYVEGGLKSWGFARFDGTEVMAYVNISANGYLIAQLTTQAQEGQKPIFHPGGQGNASGCMVLYGGAAG